jgi:P-type E1-E2 ATPase
MKLNSNGELEKVRWKDLRVGDIVKIIRDEYFAADLLILKTSELKNVCYIETKNLDGETNLKNKKLHPDM